MASRYHDVYRRWQADPEDFWAEAAAAIDWFRPYDQVFDASAGVYGRWFAGGLCNTCHNAVDRHVDGGRAAQTALIHDSAMTGSCTRFTYAELKREVEALAAVFQDLGIVKGDRIILYMPMVPEAVFAMLAAARIGAIHSVVFGGFASRELATRIDDAAPRLIVTASCGLEPGRTVAYKPLLDAAIEQARHKPEHCLVLQRPQLECALVAGRDLDYAAAGRGGARRRPQRAVRAGGGDRPALHPLHLGHDGSAQGRRARQWWAHGRPSMVDGERVRRAPRRGVLGRFGRRLGGRPFLHRLRAAPAWLHDGAVRGQAGGHAGCGHILAGHRRAWRRGAVHRADRLPGHQEGGPARRDGGPLRPRGLPNPLPGRRASRPRDPALGRGPAEGAGDRPLVADGDRIADVAEPGRARHAAGQARVARRADAGLRHPHPRRCGTRGGTGNARQRGGDAAAAAWVPADAVARRPALPRRLPGGVSGVLQDGRRRASSTTTAICSSCRAPTTSSTSPAIGCRPAAWRRCWPSIPTSPNAR